MKQILIIFKKDLRETLRDKRTLIVMIIVPLLLFPMILGITTKLQGDSNENEATRLLKVGYVAEGADLGLGAVLAHAPAMQLVPVPDTVQLRQLIRSDSLDLGVALETGFADKVDHMQTGQISTFGALTDHIAQQRLTVILDLFQQNVLRHRLDSLGLDEVAITPTKTAHFETALMKESIGKLIGGFLPYIFIIFCYMGCMFPAIDLFSGEKERGTIETLLSAPVERWKILIGKMLVVILAGITTALLSLTGLFISLQLVADIPAEIMAIALEILTPQFILALIAMLLPLVIFFAGIMIPATVYAKSFKEASSILSPLNFLVITPAVIGMMPGIELNAGTALVPVLNVVLSTKELIAGTMNWGYFLMVMASLLTLATAAVLFSFKRFGNEKNILRT
jgi:sodium transport system permease protein